MKISSIIVFILLLCHWQNPKCQDQNYIDSLRTELQQSTNDSLKVSVLSKLAGAYYNYSNDSIFSIANKIISIAQKVSNPAYQAVGNHHLGTAYLGESKYQNAIEQYQRVIEYYSSVGENGKSMSAVYNTALAYSEIGDLKRSAEYYFRALEYFQSIDDIPSVANIYNGLAITYEQFDELEKAKNYYYKGISLLGLAYDDKVDKANIFSNLSELFIKQNELDSAKHYINKTIRINRLLNLEWGLGYSYSILSTIATEENNHSQALQHALNSMRYRETVGSPNEIGESHFRLGEAYAANNRRDSAEMHYLKALDYFEKNQYPQGALDTELALSKFYEAQNELSSSLKYYRSATKLKDSLFQQEKLEALEQLNLKYEIAQKDAVLNQKEIQLSTQKRQRDLLMGGILSLLTLVCFMLYRSKKNTLIDNGNNMLKQEKIHRLEAQQKVKAINHVVKEQFSERKQVAEDLLDSLGAMLLSSRLKLNHINKKETDQTNLVAEADELLKDATNKVRSIAQEIMPEALIKLGLIAALEDLVGEYSSDSIQIKSVFRIDESILSEEQEIIIYNTIRQVLIVLKTQSNITDATLAMETDGDKLTIDIDHNGSSITKEEQYLNNVSNYVKYLEGEVLELSDSKEAYHSLQFEYPLSFISA